MSLQILSPDKARQKARNKVRAFQAAKRRKEIEKRTLELEGDIVAKGRVAPPVAKAKKLTLGDKMLEAVMVDDADGVMSSLHQGVELFGDDKLGAKALNEAVIRGNIQIATLLLAEGIDIDGENDRGFWPLSVACNEGNVGMARMLIQ
ncbi:MAG: ankyrin repeat domain-containing protein, partial [bacterium]|nr:ankyrin repeat domain-containing protein [bacterium]